MILARTRHAGIALAFSFVVALVLTLVGCAAPVSQTSKPAMLITQTYRGDTVPYIGINGILFHTGSFVVVSVEKNVPAIMKNSFAEKAGLRELDLIVSLNGEECTPEKTLVKILQKYKAGDTVTLGVERMGAGELNISLKLEAHPE